MSIIDTLIISEIVIDKIIKLINSEKDIDKKVMKVIAMFDLVGSSKIKINKSHSIGLNYINRHNQICETISKKHKGVVIKNLGDGLFVVFNSPIEACIAAIEINDVIKSSCEFSTKAGLTMGIVEATKKEGIKDYIGTAIDKCARICSLACPNQLLIDQSMLDIIQSHIHDYHIKISHPYIYKVKSFDEINVYEIVSENQQFCGYGFSSISILEDGRMPLNQKMSYLTSAKKEIIEIGVGLTSFSGDYFRERDIDFKERIISILKNNVIIKCYLLNPNCKYAKLYVTLNNEDDYIDKMKGSLKQLCEIQSELHSKKLNNFKIYTYNSFPYFHASCVDIEEPDGKMSISHYLPTNKRSKNPVIQFSKMSNEPIFNKYHETIKSLIETGKEYKMTNK